MRKLNYHGFIKDGRLEVNEVEKLVAGIKQFDNCMVKGTLEKVYEKHSDVQRGYYFAVIVQAYIIGVKAEWGDYISRQKAHEELKRECNYIEKQTKSGKLVKVGQTTTGHSTVDKEEYHERCRNHIYEWFRIVVPLPEKYY